MQSLLSLYFSNVNPFVPLLNHSIFEEAVLQGLHFGDLSFGTVLLLVCALGSLYLTPSSKEDRERMGWNWYDQVELCGHSLGHQPTLYDLQAYCVRLLSFAPAHSVFMSRMVARDPVSELCGKPPLRVEHRRIWGTAGAGDRSASERRLGDHCDRRTGEACALASEINAFSPTLIHTSQPRILLFFDTQLSGALGRSSSLEPLEFVLLSIHNYDIAHCECLFSIDISLPLEFDDEVESNDNPSTLAFFNCLLNLYRIVNFTLRSLVRRSPVHSAFHWPNADVTRLWLVPAYMQYSIPSPWTVSRWIRAPMYPASPRNSTGRSTNGSHPSPGTVSRSLAQRKLK
jgi:hypothetical protein